MATESVTSLETIEIVHSLRHFKGHLEEIEIIKRQGEKSIMSSCNCETPCMSVTCIVCNPTKIDWGKLSVQMGQIDLDLERYVKSLPLEELREQNILGENLFHYVCHHYSCPAMIQRTREGIRIIIYLLNHGVDIKKKNVYGILPTRFTYKNVELVEFFLSVGNIFDSYNVHWYLEQGPESQKVFIANDVSQKMFIANGYRLCNVRRNCSSPLVLFDRGVVQCRDAIITLLGLHKRRRHRVLPKLDRFLVRLVLAVEIWSTRTDELWTKNII